MLLPKRNAKTRTLTICTQEREGQLAARGSCGDAEASPASPSRCDGDEDAVAGRVQDRVAHLEREVLLPADGAHVAVSDEHEGAMDRRHDEAAAQPTGGRRATERGGAGRGEGAHQRLRVNMLAVLDGVDVLGEGREREGEGRARGRGGAKLSRRQRLSPPHGYRLRFPQVTQICDHRAIHESSLASTELARATRSLPTCEGRPRRSALCSRRGEQQIG